MYLLRQFLETRVGNNYSGVFKSKEKGSGYDIEDFRDYQPGDNIKQINWKLSAKYDREVLNVYKNEKDVIVDIFLDNNTNFDFFYPLYEKFSQYMQQFKYEFGFRFNVYIFEKGTIKLVGNNFFPEKININKKNNLNILFNTPEFKTSNPKMLISDLFFLEDFSFPVGKLYFGIFPIKWFEKKEFPVLNGYCGFCSDFWENYSKKLKQLEQIGVVEIFDMSI